jgi:hypothetical protein
LLSLSVPPPLIARTEEVQNNSLNLARHGLAKNRDYVH